MKNILRTIQLSSAIIVQLFGCAITTAAFIVDPTGEIHASVLSLFVTCLIYSATFLGIKLPFGHKHDPNAAITATTPQQPCEQSQR